MLEIYITLVLNKYFIRTLTLLDFLPQTWIYIKIVYFMEDRDRHCYTKGIYYLFRRELAILGNLTKVCSRNSQKDINPQKIYIVFIKDKFLYIPSAPTNLRYTGLQWFLC